jgi:hypothetical protein
MLAELRLQAKCQKKKGFRHPMLFEVKTKATAAIKENSSIYRKNQVAQNLNR